MTERMMKYKLSYKNDTSALYANSDPDDPRFVGGAYHYESYEQVYDTLDEAEAAKVRVDASYNGYDATITEVES